MLLIPTEPVNIDFPPPFTYIAVTALVQVIPGQLILPLVNAPLLRVPQIVVFPLFNIPRLTL